MKDYLRARAHGLGVVEFQARRDQQLFACLTISPAGSTMLLRVC